jgi:hypothetical protein
LTNPFLLLYAAKNHKSGRGKIHQHTTVEISVAYSCSMDQTEYDSSRIFRLCVTELLRILILVSLLFTRILCILSDHHTISHGEIVFTVTVMYRTTVSTRLTYVLETKNLN